MGVEGIGPGASVLKASCWTSTELMIVQGEILTPLLSLCLLHFVPESPRWLVHKGRETEVSNSSELHHHEFSD